MDFQNRIWKTRHKFTTSVQFDASRSSDLADLCSGSWYPYRHDENVLWLHYEDLHQDLRECVRLIADFLDIGSGDKELQDLVVHQVTDSGHPADYNLFVGEFRLHEATSKQVR